jgi:hypothetical protein
MNANHPFDNGRPGGRPPNGVAVDGAHTQPQFCVTKHHTYGRFISIVGNV